MFSDLSCWQESLIIKQVSKSTSYSKKRMSLQYQEDIDDGTTKYDYDLIVIGGGSGGMCFS